MKILRKEDLSPVGKVNKTSGFKGNLSCLIAIAHPEKLLKQEFLFLIIDGLPVPFKVEKIELKGEELIVKLEDIDSEEQAKKLVRKEICSQKLKVTKTEEIMTWKDLLGFTAIDEKHDVIGEIEDVLEYPMQMIAKCFLHGKEILFPLNDEIVTGIDDEKKLIFVKLPDGLINMYLE